MGHPMSDDDKRRKALDALAAVDQEPENIKLHWPENIEIDGLKLVCTCVACPEQYEVFDGEQQVGYLRLRHGYFYAACPDVRGERVYESQPKGDGIFDDDERMPELTAAVNAIKEWMAKHDVAG